MNTDKKMILKTLQQRGCPMTAYELARHWEPTWRVDEVQAMLQSLLIDGLVACQARSVPQYVAVVPNSGVSAAGSSGGYATQCPRAGLQHIRQSISDTRSPSIQAFPS